MFKLRPKLIIYLMMLLFTITGCNAKKEIKTIKYPNGDIYVGETQNDNPNGLGTLTLKDGSKYTGEFNNGLLNGQGTHTQELGNLVEKGQFKDGKLNGAGEIHNQFEVMKGNFKNGNLDGEGYWESGSTGDRYIGTYKNGKLIGKATIEFCNGDKYVGEVKNDSMHGTGTLTYTDGRKYIGEFKDNEPTVKGRYILANGTEIQANEITIRNELNIPLDTKLTIAQKQYVQYFVFMRQKTLEIKPLYDDILEFIKVFKDGNTNISEEDYKKLVAIDSRLKSEFQLANQIRCPLGNTLATSRTTLLSSLDLMTIGINNIITGVDSETPMYVFAGYPKVFAAYEAAFYDSDSHWDLNHKIDFEI